MAKRNLNKKSSDQTLKRAETDFVPDDAHLNIFTDRKIKKNEFGDRMAVIKTAASYYQKLSLVPDISYFGFFRYESRKQFAPPAAFLHRVEAAQTTQELKKIFFSIKPRVMSKPIQISDAQNAQIIEMMNRARLIQEGLTQQRNLVTFEKRNRPPSFKKRAQETLTHDHPAFRDTYKEALGYSTELHRNSQAESLEDVAQNCFLQIQGVIDSFSWLRQSSSSTTGRSLFVSFVVNYVFVPWGLVTVGYVPGAIVAVNFILNLGPQYVKYMDGRKYEEETSMLMGLLKVISRASVETFFVNAVTQVSGFVFGEGFLSLAGGYMIPAIGRFVMDTENRQAKITAAMETDRGSEEARLRDECLGPEPDLKNFFKNKPAVNYFAQIISEYLDKANDVKNFIVALPYTAQKILYRNFALYRTFIDYIQTVWNWTFGRPSLTCYLFEVYHKFFPSDEDTVKLNDSVSKLCRWSGIAFSAAVWSGRKVYELLLAVNPVTFLAKYVVPTVVFAILGVFFSDLLNTIPPSVLTWFFSSVPTWLSAILDSTKNNFAVSFLLESCGLGNVPAATWNLISPLFYSVADLLHINIFSSIGQPGTFFEKSFLGGFVVNFLSSVASKVPGLSLNSAETVIATFQNLRNHLFSGAELALANLLGHPETAKLATRITSLGLSVTFFAASARGVGRAPEFMYRWYERIVMTNIRVLGICTGVVGATALALTGAGYTVVAGMSPWSILALALNWINTNYLSLVPEATREVCELCNKYLYRVAESEDIIKYLQNCAASQASGVLMKLVRENIGAYISVWLPFVGTMYWQDLTGVRLRSWQTFALSLATGGLGYVGMQLFGSTRTGIKVRQCVDAMQSISIASLFRDTNFLFKWYIADSDVLEHAFSDVFRHLFVEVYTGGKINKLTQRLASTYMFAPKTVEDDLSPEERAMIAQEDRLSTDSQVKTLQGQIEGLEQTRLTELRALWDVALRYSPASGKFTERETQLLLELHRDTTKLSANYKAAIKELGEMNTDWKARYDSALTRVANSANAIDLVQSKIEVARAAHTEFVGLIDRHAVDQLSVIANGFCNEMAFWRKDTDESAMQQRTAMVKRYGDRIVDTQKQMSDALGTTFSEVEKLLEETKTLNGAVQKIVSGTYETDGISHRVEKLSALGFAQRHNKYSEQTEYLKRSIEKNESLHKLDRRLTVLQSRVLAVLLADVSETSTFQELEGVKKNLLKNSFSGSLVDKLNLALDASSQSLTMTRRNALSLVKVDEMERRETVFHELIFKPLLENEKKNVEQTILACGENLRNQKFLWENASAVLLKRNVSEKLEFLTEAQVQRATEALAKKTLLEKLGYRTVAQRSDAEKDLGHFVNLDAIEQKNILDFTSHQRRRLTDYERNILNSAKLGISLAPVVSAPPIDSVPIGTTGLIGTTEPRRRGIEIPTLALVSRQNPLVWRGNVTDGSAPKHFVSKAVALAQLVCARVKTGTEKITATLTDSVTQIKSQTTMTTSTAFGDSVPDDSPTEDEDRANVFRREEKKLAPRPEGAPTPCTEGLLKFNDANGRFLKDRLSNWFRQTPGEVVNQVLRRGDSGVQKVEAFKSIYEDWHKKIGDLDGIDKSDKTWVRENYTLMAYSKEYSERLEKIEVTPDIMQTIFPRKEQRENLDTAFDKIRAETGRPVTFDNPLFLWAISRSRAPPHILDREDPYFNLRGQLKDRAETIVRRDTSEIQERFDYNLKIFRDELEKLDSPMVPKKYGPSDIRNNEAAEKALDFTSRVKTLASSTLKCLRSLVESSLPRGVRSVIPTARIAKNIAVDFTSQLIHSRIRSNTGKYLQDFLPFNDEGEKSQRLENEFLDYMYLNAPDTEKAGVLGEAYRSCQRARNDLVKTRQKTMDLEYRIPYESLTGESSAGNFSKEYLDYQDIDNRYMPKESWILMDNYQYRPELMDALFRDSILPPKQHYEKEIYALSMALKFPE